MSAVGARRLGALRILGAALLAGGAARAREVVLLNASFDVTRELYRDENRAFAAAWKARAGDDVKIDQSHGGSSKQARSVIDGLPADVVTMNQALDVDAIAEQGKLLPRDWAARLPNHSVPFEVTPPLSVRAELPVAVVDKNAAKHGVAEVADAYLRFLFSDEGQEIAARHGLRPVDAKVLERHRASFPGLDLVSVEALGGWRAVQAKHFADGGLFDAIFEAPRAP